MPVIDTHIVKYMATKGIKISVTSNLEDYYIYAAVVRKELLQDYPNMTLAQADLETWKKMSGRA